MPAQLLELVAPLQLHMARSWKEGKVVPSGTSSILPVFVFLAADPLSRSLFSFGLERKRTVHVSTIRGYIEVYAAVILFLYSGEQEMRMYC